MGMTAQGPSGRCAPALLLLRLSLFALPLSPSLAAASEPPPAALRAGHAASSLPAAAAASRTR